MRQPTRSGARRAKEPGGDFAAREWPWQYLFPSATLCAHPRTGRIARFHVHEASLQRQFKDAVRQVGVPKRATCHTFATHILESGIDIRTEPDLLGHAAVRPP